MLMSVLMHDAADMLPPEDKELLREGSLAELLYADDTLLLSVSALSLERFLNIVSTAGAMYGLELHWDKLQLLRSGAPLQCIGQTCPESIPNLD